MRNRKIFLLFQNISAIIALIIFFPVNSYSKSLAAGDVEFWSNIRFRYEIQNNFNLKAYGEDPIAGEEDDKFLLGRFRAGFTYRPFENILLSAGIQHSDVWDNALDDSSFFNKSFNREHNSYKDSFEPYNTYALLENLLSQPLHLKIGRQKISYGNKRIFGAGEWGNTGSWIWDAAKAHYSLRRGFIDAYYGKTIIHDPNELSISHGHGFESYGLYSSLNPLIEYESFFVEPFAMTKINEKRTYIGEDGTKGDLDSYYFGLRTGELNHKIIDWEGTIVLQRGEHSSDQIRAYAYHLMLGYNFNFDLIKPQISIEYSYASGDSDPKDGINETFDAAFGSRDRMYGRINLFRWKNLQDIQLNIKLNPSESIDLILEYHEFSLADDKDAWYLNPSTYRDQTGNSGDDVGQEIDLTGTKRLPKGHVLQFGVGYFWPDEFAKNVTSNKDAVWGFLQWEWDFSHIL